MRWRLAWAAAAVALLIVAAGPVQGAAGTVGVRPNERFVYRYTIFTSFATPNGNRSSTEENMFTLGVVSTSTAGAVGEVVYSEEITEVNGTFDTTPSAMENTTAIFDPYDNSTYLGSLGFYPFTYTDLRPGSAADLPVSLTISGTPEGDITGAQSVNATVSRQTGTIGVNFTIFSGADIRPSLTVLRYNATDGVLVQGTTYTNFFSVEKDFTYSLVGTESAPAGFLSPDVQILLLSGAVVVAAFAIVWKVTSAREKGKFAKARSRIGRWRGDRLAAPRGGR